MYCPHCGYLNVEGAEVCAECGKNLYEKPSFPKMAHGTEKVHIKRSVSGRLKRKVTTDKEQKVKKFTPIKHRDDSTVKAKPKSSYTLKKEKAEVPFRPRKHKVEEKVEEVKLRKPWEVPKEAEKKTPEKPSVVDKKAEEEIVVRKPWEIPKEQVPPKEEEKEEVKIRKPWEVPKDYVPPKKEEEKKEEEEDTGFIIKDEKSVKRENLAQEFYRDLAFKIVGFILICVVAFLLIKPYFERMKSKEVAFQKEFERALQGHPTKNPEVLLAVGKHYEKKRMYQKAIQYFDKAIQYKKEFPECYAEKAKVLVLWKEDYDSALQSMNLAVRYGKGKPKYYYQRGNLYLEAEMYNKAVDDFSKYIEAMPERGEGYIGRGKAYKKLRKYDEALKDFEEASKFESTKSQAKKLIASTLYLIGAREKTSGSIDRAIDILTKAYKTDPDNADVRRELSLALFEKGKGLEKLGKIQEALRFYSEAVKVRRKFAKAYYQRGKLYLKLKDKKKAAFDFKGAYDLEPRNEVYRKTLLSFMLKKGEEDFRKGNSSDIIFDYSAIIQIQPDNAIARLRRGIAYFKIKKYGRAIIDLEEAFKIKPSISPKYEKVLVDSYLAYAKHKYEGADYGRALDLYDKYLEKRPASVEGYTGRALVYEKLGKRDLADADIKKALSLRPNDPDVELVYAKILLDRGKTRESLSLLNKIVKEAPHRPEGYYLRAKVYKRLKDNKKAEEDWKKVRDLAEVGSDMWIEAKKELKEKIDEDVLKRGKKR